VKNLFLFSIATLSLAACGRGTSTNNPFRAPAEKLDAPEIQHTFEAECVRSHKSWISSIKALAKGTADVYPQSERSQIIFRAGNATFKEIHYLGENCDGGEAYAFTEEGSYRVGDKSQNEHTNGLRHLDIKMDSVHATALSPEGVKFANAYALCDKKDWKIGSKENVTTSAAQNNCYDVTPRREIANVYQVDDNKLELGYAGDKAVAKDDRPTTITSKVFYRKH